VADDLRHERRLFRRLLPRRTTTNVVAELGAEDAERTILFIAHHDAAHTGAVFEPEGARRIARRFPTFWDGLMTTPPTLWAAFIGPLFVGLGALLGMPRLRRTGRVLAAGHAIAMADIGARSVVPGANDNATAVAVILGLARAFREDPLPGTRVILLSTGSEESFSEGMQGFAERHFPSLDPATTYSVAVDTVGSPTLLALEGEGMLGIWEYPEDMIELIHATAADLGIDVWRGLRFRNATDGVFGLKAGFKAASIGSVDEYKLPTNYHWPTDTAENVDYGTVEEAARLCEALARRISEPADVLEVAVEA
jgi:putative aminopeptidase FrvX